MDIKYLGHSSFYVKSKDSRLVTDPFDSAIGIKFSKTEADVVTVSHHHSDHDASELVTAPGGAAPLVIDMPGEFERLGFRIFGYQSYHDAEKGARRGENILYKIEKEDLSILHCGDLGIVPDDSFLDAIGEVDILMVPVGGFYTIDADQAVELVKKVEPSIVVPMHYNSPKLNKETFGSLLPVSEFLKKIGHDDVVPIPKLSIKKEDLADEMKVVVMDISS